MHEPGLLKQAPLSQAVAATTCRTLEEAAQAQACAMAAYLPRRAVLPGKTPADVFWGQWPGDETEEQIQAALDELS